MEPLTFRGRRGTGIPGTRRSGYTDERLETRWDWEKFIPWYRVWGRLTYNADAGAGPAQRPFGTGPRARAMSSALAHASRILPLVTTAHLPSAACDAYWPEIYWNQSIVEEPRPNPYGDTPSPKVFAHVSPLDPELFSTMDEFADELLAGRPGARYSPIEVATWLLELASVVFENLKAIEHGTAPEVRRLVVDAKIQAGLGQFFATKFRSGVLFAIYEKTGNQEARESAWTAYFGARNMWTTLALLARDVYAADLSVSDKLSERGHWIDRVPAMNEDLDRVAYATSAGSSTADESRVRAAVQYALGAYGAPTAPANRPSVCVHTPPPGLASDADVALELRMAAGHSASEVLCHYRHVNQAERFEIVAMERQGSVFRANIPAAYASSPYPLQYYFTLAMEPTGSAMFPGLGSQRMSLPYFVLRRH
jgi:hypothetical protein